MECLADKTMYTPGERVVLQLACVPPTASSLHITLFHLDEVVMTNDAAADSKSVSFSLPEKDYTGYLLQVQALDKTQRVLATAHTAVDCSSNWTRFPRYGYVWDFTPEADIQSKIEQMTRYHLNGIQFYDWQYRHHIPVAPDRQGWRD